MCEPEHSDIQRHSGIQNMLRMTHLEYRLHIQYAGIQASTLILTVDANIKEDSTVSCK
jgi:hypothetical protein